MMAGVEPSRTVTLGGFSCLPMYFAQWHFHLSHTRRPGLGWALLYWAMTR